MRKTAFLVCVTLAVLAAAACKNAPTGPTANSPGPAGTLSTDKSATITNEAFVGKWLATKAEFWRAPAPNILCDRRDLVAEGGTVTLMLEQGGPYSVSVTMPGEKTGVSTGRWHYHEFWGKPQIDFYLSSIPDPEYGEVPSFYVTLSGDTLTLWDGGSIFLPFDFGYNDPPHTVFGVVVFVFTRM
jgi:hypothetical protein